jgi:tetratricopeptide (TPR) repeat protein
MKPKVQVRTEGLTIPTYLPALPDKNPMFLEKRVYQGSNGKVYPLPFTDRISETKIDRKWKAIWLENQFLRVLILPEIGGRIHAIQDKSNGYDLIYNQPVIKPALVGLAGPWISGGIEFNWPQHHRPATFLPVDFKIEAHADGSKTVWCSDHDPMARMKGMHGICLHPDKAIVELKVRAYNRTPFVQTFLWWANVATRVHEGYQSFFPPDVYYVADHARRSTSEYPLCESRYYGVNYAERGRRGIPQNEIPKQFVPAHCGGKGKGRKEKDGLNEQGSHLDYAANDLSFYANIPTPCSYMCMGSQEDFFGGYDYFAQAGIIHYANHHISPGKKQWTWGNHDFGYAWDRNLTEPDARGEYGPYIEIMAGVYTDNQPDFSFLQPGETKSWSQYWYPIQKIGPARHANLNAAVSLEISTATATRVLRLGIAVTADQPRAQIELAARGRSLTKLIRHLSPSRPFVRQFILSRGVADSDLSVTITDGAGRELISYSPKPRAKGQVPPPATEPPAPAEMASVDELFITGLHLEQYRHATRSPTLYWEEALRRDPLDSRCNNAIGLWHLRRGEYAEAEKHFRKAIERLTRRNANPYDGEVYYNLGLCLRPGCRLSALEDSKAGLLTSAPARDEAYARFYKATWNQAWAGAGYHALAEMDCVSGNWVAALEHLNRSLRFDTDNLRARNLKVIVLRRLNRKPKAAAILRETLVLDPLDWWARYLNGEPPACDLQTALDIAHDYARAGLYAEAIGLLEARLSQSEKATKSHALPDQSWGALPLIHYTLGWLHQLAGNRKKATRLFRRGATLTPDFCFPSRLEEISVLQSAMAADPQDARAPYYVGNLLYDRRRHEEAIHFWERSARLDPGYSVVWRNLGIGYFNVCRNHLLARKAYDRAFKANPRDGRVLYERDQLWKRLGEKPVRRLRELEKHSVLVRRRDDLSVELCALYNQTGQPAKALQLLKSRRFQPWEGGEGGPLGQHVRTHLALGRSALAAGNAESAQYFFELALTSPDNLSEAKHLLANQSDIHYWLGIALDRLGELKKARDHWRLAATFKGDFQEMSVRPFSEMTYYSALAWKQLGQKTKAHKLLQNLLRHARQLQTSAAQIDYFATSLPTMLLFDDDLQFRQETTALFLQAQAWLGLGKKKQARRLLQQVLKRDPNNALAADLFGDLTHAH